MLEVFGASLDHPGPWAIVGDSLLRSSQPLLVALKALHDQPGGKRNLRDEWSFHLTWLMLRGLSIENFLKAILSQAMSDADRNELAKGNLPRRFASHNLVKLAGQAGLVLNTREEALLGRLHDAVEWTARYPAPLKAQKLDGKLNTFTRWSDVDEVEDLTVKIRALARP